MNKRLTRAELRIIEETKREGIEASQREQEAGQQTKRSAWSLVWFVVIFAALCLGFSLLISLTR